MPPRSAPSRLRRRRPFSRSAFLSDIAASADLPKSDYVIFRTTFSPRNQTERNGPLPAASSATRISSIAISRGSREGRRTPRRSREGPPDEGNHTAVQASFGLLLEWGLSSGRKLRLHPVCSRLQRPWRFPAHALSMREPPSAAGLVTSSCRTPATLPCIGAAIPSAVNLAAIATATDQRLRATRSEQKQPRRSSVVMVGFADAMWTTAQLSAILIDRTCVPGTVWGTASSRTGKSRSTPCLSLKRQSLPQHPPLRQGATTRRRINLSHAPSSSRQVQREPPSSQPRHLCTHFRRHRQRAVSALRRFGYSILTLQIFIIIESDIRY
jgi:hypothetical protein